ncbi:MAG: hypothetical protein ACTHWQ_05480 [Sphingobacterium sp.]
MYFAIIPFLSGMFSALFFHLMGTKGSRSGFEEIQIDRLMSPAAGLQDNYASPFIVPGFLLFSCHDLEGE